MQENSGGFKLSAFLGPVLYRLDLGDTCREYLDRLADPQTSTPLFLARVIESNQAYDHFLKTSDLLQKRKSKWTEADEPVKKGEDGKPIPGSQAPKYGETERMILLLGRNPTRNALLNLRLMRMLGEGLPKTEKDGLSLKPSNYFKFALKIEEFAMERGLTHPEHIFLGGLLYDWILHLVESQKLGGKGAAASLDGAWKSSLKTAQITYKLGMSLKSFKLDKYAFSAGLAMGLGRFFMDVFFPSSKAQPGWQDVWDRVMAVKTQDFQALSLILERKQFKVDAPAIAGLLCSFFAPLRGASLALTHAYDPYLLRTANPDSYRLALLLNAADRLSFTSALTANQRKSLAELGIKEMQLKVATTGIKEN